MELTRSELVDAVETGCFLLPETPGYLRELSFDGAKGRIATVSHPYLNTVGLARFGSADAAAAIDSIKAIYAEQGNAITWIVGPSSTPRELGALLIDAGFRKIVDLAGMAHQDLGRSVSEAPGVTTRKAGPEQRDLVLATTARAGGLSEEFARFSVDLREELRGRLDTDTYLAFAEGAELPVGFATMTYFPDRPVVELGGAATMPEHRGKGVYSSLLSRRLGDAYARGMEAAVLQAARVTSAPICGRYGFVEVCSLEYYLWVPEQLSEGLSGEFGLDGSLVADDSPQPSN
jgi:GNAT superfamily N-acetyltransferase